MFDRYSETAYGVMRIVVGFLFACHGAQKLFGLFGAQARVHDPWLMTAAIIESIAGTMICLGLFSSLAGFVASGEMAVAYLKAHAAQGLWPIENHGELAVLYCFVFLYIASRGDGAWSLRRLLQQKSRERKTSREAVHRTPPAIPASSQRTNAPSRRRAQ